MSQYVRQRHDVIFLNYKFIWCIIAATTEPKSDFNYDTLREE